MPERYLLWRGNNTFFCGGRFMTGSHPKQLLRTFIIILFSWLVYIFLVAPFFSFKWLIPIAMCQFEVNCILLCLTAFTDPGIIPRKTSKESPIMCRLSFCNVCEVYRDNRARHCRYCDNCVKVFDHHCPWTGTCIGLRNYSYFFLFLLSVSVGLWFMLLSALLLLLGWIFSVPTNAYILRCVVVCMVIPWSLMLLLPTSLLLGFHIYLILTGQSTAEYFSTKRQRQQFIQQQQQMKLPIKTKGKSVRHVRYAAISTEGQLHQSEMMQYSSLFDSTLEQGTLAALFLSDDDSTAALSPTNDGSAEPPAAPISVKSDAVSEMSSGSSGSGSSVFIALLCVLYPAAAAAASSTATVPSHFCVRRESTHQADLNNNSTLSSMKSTDEDNPDPLTATATDNGTSVGPERRESCLSVSCCRSSDLPPMWQMASPDEE